MNATLDLLRQFEGYREAPYWDVNALRAGYGSDTMTLADGSVVPVGKDTRVSREDAERDLARRVESEFMPRVVAAVGPDVFATLSDGQKAALGSITYNYGSLPDSVARAVRSGDPAAAATAIAALGSHNEGVNRDRRSKEAAIYSGAASIPSSGGAGVDRLALAYASGQMTPEDARLYEQGMADGTFQTAKKPEPKKPDIAPQTGELQGYAAMMAARQRSQQPFQTIQAGQAVNATPLQRFPGI